jgi:hypothetical protein
MLRISQWNQFFIQYLIHTFAFFIPILIVSFLFSSGFTYMGGDTSSFFLLVAKSQPDAILYSLLKITAVGLALCIGLQLICSSFSLKFKIIFGFLFFLSGILRVATIYPAVTENWIIVQNFNSIRNMVQILSTLSENSKIRLIIQWSPFLICLSAFLMNLFLHMKSMILQSKIIRKAHDSIYVDVLDYSSQVFSIQGTSFLISIVFGGGFLFYLTSSFSVTLPKNNTKSDRPNVFIFAIDSFRYDRMSQKEFSNIMPFLKSKLPQSTLFEPMLVGVPRTFPSWVEMATGSYALKTSVRTMFPSKSSRMGKKETIFQVAKDSGYSTVFVSDFAGDIFPRYPFGATLINAPSSNLYTLIENGFIVNLSAMQSILILPNLQSLMPSILESAEIADPRLVAHTISDSLSLVSQNASPVFLTAFFSSSHFPYASPGPWYAELQKKDLNGHFMFRKIPDQIAHAETLSHTHIAINKQQTIALYDGGLNAIDLTFKDLFKELERKGWLKNSIILIFGDHGENLYDGNMGMGHGDGVQGEYSNVTPLIIFTNGNAKSNPTTEKLNLVRTIDLAPTIAKKIHVHMNEDQMEGRPLLDQMNETPNFPMDSAYMETGIWFTSGNRSPENQPRVIYPGITALVNIDTGMNFEFYLRPAYAQSIPGLKERAWIDKKYRLVTRTTSSGVKLSLYERNDRDAKHDLLADSGSSKKYHLIANSMLKRMNAYLVSCGVEIVQNATGSFFYSENITQ